MTVGEKLLDFVKFQLKKGVLIRARISSMHSYLILLRLQMKRKNCIYRKGVILE